MIVTVVSFYDGRMHYSTYVVSLALALFGEDCLSCSSLVVDVLVPSVGDACPCPTTESDLHLEQVTKIVVLI